MANPTTKSPAIDKLLEAITGNNRVTSIENNTCTFCRQPATSFRDALSEREYAISGLCQRCQDGTFDVPEEPSTQFEQDDFFARAIAAGSINLDDIEAHEQQAFDPLIDESHPVSLF